MRVYRNRSLWYQNNAGPEGVNNNHGLDRIETTLAVMSGVYWNVYNQGCGSGSDRSRIFGLNTELPSSKSSDTYSSAPTDWTRIFLDDRFQIRVNSARIRNPVYNYPIPHSRSGPLIGWVCLQFPASLCMVCFSHYLVEIVNLSDYNFSQLARLKYLPSRYSI